MRRVVGLVLAVILAGVLVGCEDDDAIVEPRVVLPVPPQGVFSVTGNEFVTVHWDGVYDNSITEFGVYRSDALDGKYDPIGNVAANAHAEDTLWHYTYVDGNVANGNTYYYAVTSINSNGVESKLSAEDVWDTPRPDGTVFLFPQDLAPEVCGFNFETGTPRPDTSSIADFYISRNLAGDMYYLTVDGDTYFMDMGYTGDFDEISFSPSTHLDTGWSMSYSAELIVGHTYVFWMNADNHFAKIRPKKINTSHSVEIQWAWQVDTGNPELAPEIGNRNEPGRAIDTNTVTRVDQTRESM